DQFKDHPANEDLTDAKKHAKTLFTKLGNGYDITALLEAIAAIGMMSRNNTGFDELTNDARDFGRWAMDVDAQELTSDEFKTRSEALIDKCHHVLSDEERDHFKVLSSESTGYMNAVRDNPVIADYKNSMVDLAHTVTGSELSEEERREHIHALRQDIMTNLPAMIQAIRYVPLPRIAGQSKDIEFAADNIVLDLKNFVPEHMSLNSHSEIYPRAMMLKDKSAKQSDMGFHGEQFFKLQMTGIHFVAKRVAFYIKKKRGLPRVAEKGIANLIVDGHGMDISVYLRRLHGSEKPKVPIETSAAESDKGKAAEGAATTRSKRELDIVDVKVKIHSLDVKVRELRHTISSKLALTLMKPVARKLIARSIAKSLTENLVRADELMAKYGTTAQDFVMVNTKKAMSSAKGAAKKGTKAGKEQINKAHKKGNKAADKVSDIADKSADKSADKTHRRHDSLVDQEPAPAIVHEAI
ncbi:hypothetical protein IWW50_001934, partial [Coemansia erecta]